MTIVAKVFSGHLAYLGTRSIQLNSPLEIGWFLAMLKLGRSRGRRGNDGTTV